MRLIPSVNKDGAGLNSTCVCIYKVCVQIHIRAHTRGSVGVYVDNTMRESERERDRERARESERERERESHQVCILSCVSGHDRHILLHVHKTCASPNQSTHRHVCMCAHTHVHKPSLPQSRTQPCTQAYGLQI